MTRVFDVFLACHHSIQARENIHRLSVTEKEFHFQDWVRDRLSDIGLEPLEIKRLKYPDFVIPNPPEGYEVKGLEFPGRYVDYDANSQPPTGFHKGWTIYYVFGRYPKGGGTDFPVVDLVVCHGDFLNANHEYVHKNKHVKGFGSYGDIMIRDRKMYVVPTPYALVPKTVGKITLIVPAEFEAPAPLVSVGTLVRREAEQLVVGYRFDLKTNEIEAEYRPNEDAGREHTFTAYQVSGEDNPVYLASDAAVTDQHEQVLASDEEYEDES